MSSTTSVYLHSGIPSVHPSTDNVAGLIGVVQPAVMWDPVKRTINNAFPAFHHLHLHPHPLWQLQRRNRPPYLPSPLDRWQLTVHRRPTGLWLMVQDQYFLIEAGEQKEEVEWPPKQHSIS